jgi:hypothetical protein
MNAQLQAFARQTLKEKLPQLPEEWQNLFKKLYADHTGKKINSYEHALSIPIEDIIDHMPEEKLDWAMTQVDNSFKKLAEKQYE